MSLFYNLAGLTVEIDDCLDPDAKKQLSLYEIAPVENPDIRFIFHTGCEHLTFPDGEKIVEIYGRHWFKMADGGYAFADQADEISPDVLNLMIASKDFKIVESWFSKPELLHLEDDRRPYHLIGEVLKYALLPYDGLMIHASSVAYQNKGILFSAPSGTGKSTHTSLWKKYAPGSEIVNDDMPILRLDSGKVMLAGAPWSGKNSIHQNITVPLSAIVFLERGTTCSLTPMDTTEAIFRIYDAVRKPAMEDLAEKTLELLGEILSTVPVYLLRCDMSETAVKTSMQALL